MTQEHAHYSRALDSFAVSALGITFFLRYAHFLTAHELFGPFVDNVHMYGPIFSEVSRLALAGAVPYYLPGIGTGFPVFETPSRSCLEPPALMPFNLGMANTAARVLQLRRTSAKYRCCG